eukprot:2166814-Amphidinium_carterae.1
MSGPWASCVCLCLSYTELHIIVSRSPALLSLDWLSNGLFAFALAGSGLALISCACLFCAPCFVFIRLASGSLSCFGVSRCATMPAALAGPALLADECSQPDAFEQPMSQRMDAHAEEAEMRPMPLLEATQAVRLRLDSGRMHHNPWQGTLCVRAERCSSAPED